MDWTLQKRKRIFHYLEKIKQVVICLQEIYIKTGDKKNLIQKNLGEEFFQLIWRKKDWFCMVKKYLKSELIFSNEIVSDGGYSWWKKLLDSIGIHEICNHNGSGNRSQTMIPDPYEYRGLSCMILILEILFFCKLLHFHRSTSLKWIIFTSASYVMFCLLNKFICVAD